MKENTQNIIVKAAVWVNTYIIRPAMVGIFYGMGNVLGAATIRYFFISKIAKWYNNYPEKFMQNVAGI